MRYFFYRNKYLFLYIIFGFVSISFELLLLNFFKLGFLSDGINSIIALFCGILLAFYLNINFNFHISKKKRFKSLIYFFIISIFSYSLQNFIIVNYIDNIPFEKSFEKSRFIVSGVMFIFFYFIHKKFSFSDYKKVGVAIYADGVEDISKIYKSIKDVSDFIHIDIVDKTFNQKASLVKAYRAETIRAYWPNKKLEVHIMSKFPSKFLTELVSYVDIIYFHINIDESIDGLIKKIKKSNCEPGLVISVNDDFDKIFETIYKFKNLLVLSIEKPGFSGQNFQYKTLDLINKIQDLKKSQNFNICVDGGVNLKTIKVLNVDSVVSGSFVLKSKNPINNILYLKSGGYYEKV